MTVKHRWEYLSHDLGSLILREWSLILNFIKKFSSCAELRYNIKESFILIKLEDFDDIRMILKMRYNCYQALQNRNLIH